MGIFVFFAFSFAYLSWAYAGFFIFQTLDDKDQIVKYLISTLVSVFAVISLLEMHNIKRGDLLARLVLLIVVTALSLFYWAITANSKKQLEFAYTSTKDKEIITSGPFSIIRHPFYLSYLMTWFSYALYAQSILSLLIFLATACLFISAALSEERELGKNELYENYKKRVGMFMPKISFYKKLLRLEIHSD